MFRLHHPILPLHELENNAPIAIQARRTFDNVIVNKKEPHSPELSTAMYCVDICRMDVYGWSITSELGIMFLYAAP